MKNKNKNKIKFTKEDIEYILGRDLLDFEYDFITKAVPNIRNNGYLCVLWARGNHKTRLRRETTILSSIITDDIIFEEVHHD